MPERDRGKQITEKKEGQEERHKLDLMCAPSFAIMSIVPVVQTLDARMIVPRERDRKLVGLAKPARRHARKDTWGRCRFVANCCIRCKSCGRSWCNCGCAYFHNLSALEGSSILRNIIERGMSVVVRAWPILKITWWSSFLKRTYNRSCGALTSANENAS
jgi:hypothetical protein